MHDRQAILRDKKQIMLHHDPSLLTFPHLLDNKQHDANEVTLMQSEPLFLTEITMTSIDSSPRNDIYRMHSRHSVLLIHNLLSTISVH